MSTRSRCSSPNGEHTLRLDGASTSSSPRRKLCKIGGAFFVLLNIVALYVLHFVDRSEVLHALETSRPVLLLAGDSITEKGSDPSMDGWVCRLQNRYLRSADVVPRGLSGYTTKTYMEKAIPVLEYEMSVGGLSPSITTIWLGANDAALSNGSDSAKHVDLETYSANLEAIVGKLQIQMPDSQILLITPPHVDDAARQALAGSANVDRSNNVTGQYARACVETAQTLGVPVLDLYSYFNAMNESERNAYLVDGLHFTASGNRVVDEQLRATFTTEFPELVTRLDAETWQLPDSNIVD